jgi:hypothetical protein
VTSGSPDRQTIWKRRAKRLHSVGCYLMGLGYCWLAGIFWLVWFIFPSEAQAAMSHHMAGKETFTKVEVRQLIDTMVSEETKAYPNPIYPMLLLLGGSLAIGISRGLAEEPNSKSGK